MDPCFKKQCTVLPVRHREVSGVGECVRASSSSQLMPGSLLTSGLYQITEEVSRGPSHSVFKALQTKKKEIVLLKIDNKRVISRRRACFKESSSQSPPLRSQSLGRHSSPTIGVRKSKSPSSHQLRVLPTRSSAKKISGLNGTSFPGASTQSSAGHRGFGSSNRSSLGSTNQQKRRSNDILQENGELLCVRVKKQLQRRSDTTCEPVNILLSAGGDGTVTNDFFSFSSSTASSLPSFPSISALHYVPSGDGRQSGEAGTKPPIAPSYPVRFQTLLYAPKSDPAVGHLSASSATFCGNPSFLSSNTALLHHRESGSSSSVVALQGSVFHCSEASVPLSSTILDSSDDALLSTASRTKGRDASKQSRSAIAYEASVLHSILHIFCHHYSVETLSAQSYNPSLQTPRSLITESSNGVWVQASRQARSSSPGVVNQKSAPHFPFLLTPPNSYKGRSLSQPSGCGTPMSHSPASQVPVQYSNELPYPPTELSSITPTPHIQTEFSAHEYPAYSSCHSWDTGEPKGSGTAIKSALGVGLADVLPTSVNPAILCGYDDSQVRSFTMGPPSNVDVSGSMVPATKLSPPCILPFPSTSISVSRQSSVPYRSSAPLSRKSHHAVLRRSQDPLYSPFWEKSRKTKSADIFRSLIHTPTNHGRSQGCSYVVFPLLGPDLLQTQSQFLREGHLLDNLWQQRLMLSRSSLSNLSVSKKLCRKDILHRYPLVEPYLDHTKCYPLRSVCCIGIQVLKALQLVHQTGYIHGAVQPEHISFPSKALPMEYIVEGKSEKISREDAHQRYPKELEAFLLQFSANVVLSEFGFCRRYTVLNLQDGADGASWSSHRDGHVGKKRVVHSFIGRNPFFLSLGMHNGLTLSRRDDLEQWVYVLIFLLRGRLPWSSAIDQEDKKLFEFSGEMFSPEEEKAREGRRREIVQRIGSMKKKMSCSEICYGCPPCIEHLLSYTRCLCFDEVPSYDWCSVRLEEMREAVEPEPPSAVLLLTPSSSPCLSVNDPLYTSSLSPSILMAQQSPASPELSAGKGEVAFLTTPSDTLASPGDASSHFTHFLAPPAANEMGTPMRLEQVNEQEMGLFRSPENHAHTMAPQDEMEGAVEGPPSPSMEITVGGTQKNASQSVAHSHTQVYTSLAPNIQEEHGAVGSCCCCYAAQSTSNPVLVACQDETSDVLRTLTCPSSYHSPSCPHMAVFRGVSAEAGTRDESNAYPYISIVGPCDSTGQPGVWDSEILSPELHVITPIASGRFTPSSPLLCTAGPHPSCGALAHMEQVSKLHRALQSREKKRSSTNVAPISTLVGPCSSSWPCFGGALPAVPVTGPYQCGNGLPDSPSPLNYITEVKSFYVNPANITRKSQRMSPPPPKEKAIHYTGDLDLPGSEGIFASSRHSSLRKSIDISTIEQTIPRNISEIKNKALAEPCESADKKEATTKSFTASKQSYLDYSIDVARYSNQSALSNASLSPVLPAEVNKNLSFLIEVESDGSLVTVVANKKRESSVVRPPAPPLLVPRAPSSSPRRFQFIARSFNLSVTSKPSSMAVEPEGADKEDHSF